MLPNQKKKKKVKPKSVEALFCRLELVADEGKSRAKRPAWNLTQSRFHRDQSHFWHTCETFPTTSAGLERSRRATRQMRPEPPAPPRRSRRASAADEISAGLFLSIPESVPFVPTISAVAEPPPLLIEGHLLGCIWESLGSMW